MNMETDEVGELIKGFGVPVAPRFGQLQRETGCGILGRTIRVAGKDQDNGQRER